MHVCTFDILHIIYIVLLFVHVQFLNCVAPNVNYHLKNTKDMVQGAAIRLQVFLNYLDSHGIPHASHKVIRRKTKKCKRCAPRKRQYFLRKDVVVSLRKIRRELAECKGCICIPRDQLKEGFIEAFKHSIRKPDYW